MHAGTFRPALYRLDFQNSQIDPPDWQHPVQHRQAGRRVHHHFRRFDTYSQQYCRPAFSEL